jgi:radical SAM protein with 4Fe4S-binding SPASM domain
MEMRLLARQGFSCKNCGDNITYPEKFIKSFLEQAKIKYIYQLSKKDFNWCDKYKYGFHPMVNAHSIEKWKEQGEWWIRKIKERNLDLYQCTMFLEVRNDEWTEDKIKHYLAYLNTMVNLTLELIHDNDLERYIRTVLRCPIDGERKRVNNYDAQGFNFTGANKGCGIDRLLSIRLGDLAWVPCHRLSYEKLIYGRLSVNEDKKIVGIEALNIPLFVGINSLSYKGHFKCDTCPIAQICTRGCYGAQFEAHKEIYYPCETVCDLYKARFIFLYHKYTSMGIMNEPEDKIIDDIIKQINETEEYKKWTQIALQII